MKSTLQKNHITHVIRRLTTTASSISIIQNEVKDMASKGLYENTLRFYKQELHPSGLYAYTSLLPSVIKACAYTQFQYHFGLQLHCIALKSGSDSDPVISNSLISMYAKFSETESAYQVFDIMPYRNTISWNSIIYCFTQNGYYVRSLKMLKDMYLCGFVPKDELIAGIISLCAQVGDLSVARQIHSLFIVEGRIEGSVFVSTALLDLYSRYHHLLIALRVFDGMEVKNEVSWTAMISGCIDNHNYDMAIDCFRAMQRQGFKPNRVTLLVVLLACTELQYMKDGKAIHGYAFRYCIDSDPHLSAALMHMYCKCTEALTPARIIFERSKVKDVVMWSSIINGYSRSGDSGEAMKLFSQMRQEGIAPNTVTLLAIISACANLSSLTHGLGVHCYTMKAGLGFHVSIGNAMINMYAKCGCLASSHRVFKEMAIKDLVSWSALISSYGLQGYGEEALQIFLEMQERGVEPDAITILAILSAFNHAGLVKEAETLFNNLIQGNIIALGIEHYACYVDLLGKSGKIEDACKVVSTMPMKPSTKILSSLVSACKIHGNLEAAEILAHQLIESEPENAANYTLLSMIYGESGKWFDVEEVRRVMRAKRLTKCYGFSRV
ncbi:Pentatricopeptide repeat-containing protein [Melia azedarach]|uniref:Pentatricopeptide repeat-containing protein n=1 Tax=Melia azedarach TaxID=155640 RepID=A0ACC1XEE3_MELAZ|nr:Pentatricopeptide repeat-containing protein [Melia azedarach]